MLDDRTMYTLVGHRGLAICNPIGEATLDRVLARLPATRALDVGCGKAEILIRLAERGCRGVGIDCSAPLLAEARTAVERRAPGLVELIEADATQGPLPAGPFDVTVALGASHALGGTAAALARLTEATTNGGHVLLGEGYWRRVPTDDELARIGAARDEMLCLSALVAAFEGAGLEVSDVALATRAELDRYEAAHHANVEAHARAHPDDPQAERLWARRRAWQIAYVEGWRDLLGFALVVGSRRLR